MVFVNDGNNRFIKQQLLNPTFDGSLPLQGLVPVDSVDTVATKSQLFNTLMKKWEQGSINFEQLKSELKELGINFNDNISFITFDFDGKKYSIFDPSAGPIPLVPKKPFVKFPKDQPLLPEITDPPLTTEPEEGTNLNKGIPIIDNTLQELKKDVEAAVTEILGSLDSAVVDKILKDIEQYAKEWLESYTGVSDALPNAIPSIMTTKMNELIEALKTEHANEPVPTPETPEVGGTQGTLPVYATVEEARAAAEEYINAAIEKIKQERPELFEDLEPEDYPTINLTWQCMVGDQLYTAEARKQVDVSYIASSPAYVNLRTIDFDQSPIQGIWIRGDQSVVRFYGKEANNQYSYEMSHYAVNECMKSKESFIESGIIYGKYDQIYNINTAPVNIAELIENLMDEGYFGDQNPVTINYISVEEVTESNSSYKYTTKVLPDGTKLFPEKTYTATKYVDENGVEVFIADKGLSQNTGYYYDLNGNKYDENLNLVATNAKPNTGIVTPQEPGSDESTPSIPDEEPVVDTPVVDTPVVEEPPVDTPVVDPEDNAKLEQAIKDMYLRTTYCEGVYCPVMPDANGNRVHYVWDSVNDKMVSIGTYKHLSSDGHEAKDNPNWQAYKQGYNFTDKEGVYEKGGKLYSYDNGSFQEIKPELDEIEDSPVTSAPEETLPAEETPEVKTKTLAELTGNDVNIIIDDIDYSTIPGYYANERENISDSASSREDVVKMLTNNLKSQLKAQLTEQLNAVGIKFSEIENLFNNIFTQTAWDTVDSYDKGLRVKYNVADLVNKFLKDFNKNFDNAINAMNKSDKDMDLTDLSLGYIMGQYDVESGDRYNTGSKDGATMQMRVISSNLYTQLKNKAIQMCKANGIDYNSSIFETMFNNAKAYATANCDLSDNGKKYNPQDFLENLLNTFKKNYTDWVNAELKPQTPPTRSSAEDLTNKDLKINTKTIDYSKISGYYEKEWETTGDSGEKKEAVVNMLDKGLKSQLKSQLTSQLSAMGLKFSDIENLFNNIFTQTAWQTVNSFDKGLRVKYHVNELVDKFLTNFNTNLAKAIADKNKSNKDMDLNDLNLTNILKKYDVEYNETDKVGSKRDSAEDQAKAIANELKSQLKDKAKKMCEANGVKFNENAFNTQFNNSVAYALEHCNMSNNGKKYNATQFLKNFLTKFESNYTSWVNRQ